MRCWSSHPQAKLAARCLKRKRAISHQDNTNLCHERQKSRQPSCSFSASHAPSCNMSDIYVGAFKGHKFKILFSGTNLTFSWCVFALHHFLSKHKDTGTAVQPLKFVVPRPCELYENVRFWGLDLHQTAHHQP